MVMDTAWKTDAQFDVVYLGKVCVQTEEAIKKRILIRQPHHKEIELIAESITNHSSDRVTEPSSSVISTFGY